MVAGDASNGTVDLLAVARFNADGTLDGSFATGGIYTQQFGTSTTIVSDVVIQADGKIIVGGYASFSGTSNDFILLRLTSSGTPDASFGSSGVVTTAVSTGSDFLQSVLLPGDGTIIAVGYNSSTSGYGIAVVRYRADGTLDTSFNGDGIATTNVGPSLDTAFGARFKPTAGSSSPAISGQHVCADPVRRRRAALPDA